MLKPERDRLAPMSKSRKRMPITGSTTAESDKTYKQAEHQRERSAAKIAIQQGEQPLAPRAYGNPWFSEKDGKQYWADMERVRRK